MKCQPSFKKNRSLCSILIIGCWCLIFAASFHISQGNAYAAQVTLAWDTSDEAAGYKIYYGTASNTYTSVVDVGPNLTYTFTDLPDGNTYYFAATAYDATYLESDFSTEISYATVSSQTEILWRNTSFTWTA
jgi:fibronectin type 3 domain-containing protein